MSTRLLQDVAVLYGHASVISKGCSGVKSISNNFFDPCSSSGISRIGARKNEYESSSYLQFDEKYRNFPVFDAPALRGFNNSKSFCHIILQPSLPIAFRQSCIRVERSNFISPAFISKNTARNSKSFHSPKVDVFKKLNQNSENPWKINSAPSNAVASVIHNECNDKEFDTLSSDQITVKEWSVTRLAVWGAILFGFYFLRSFLGIAIGTMVLSMLATSIVSWAEKKFSIKRRVAIASLYLLIVSLALAFFIKLFPSILQESTLIVNNLQTDKPYVVLLESLRRIFGEGFANQVDDLVFAFVKIAARLPSNIASKSEVQSSDLIQTILQRYAGRVIPFILKIFSSLVNFLMQTVLSLLFSFLILWDFSALKRGAQSLKNSKISIFYQEIAPVAASFGGIFQRALQAQAMIAVANTLLTTFALLALQIYPIVQLSLFVLFCSFIPIAGVIVSTIPIGIIALAESGIFKLSLVILMVILIHAVEAYILNPTIYSAHLSLHPIITLSVLFIAEHNLGIWGLLLAVPIASFMIDTFVWGTSQIPASKIKSSTTFVSADDGNKPFASDGKSSVSPSPA